MTNRKTYTGFQRNHLGPLKFKMADVCNIENRFGGITHSHLSALSEILRKEAVFHRISTMGQIHAFHRTYFLFPKCSWGLRLRQVRAFRIVSDTLVSKGSVIETCIRSVVWYTAAYS